MNYDMLKKQTLALAGEEKWYVPLMANVSALIYEQMEDLNWAGFYIVREGGLTLGPFQGKAACIHIAPGKGVCGAAMAQDRTERVPDVHAFPGHIACDGASNSEIVIPLHRDGQVAAVLDIDSPRLDRFSPEDQEGLEALVRALETEIEY